MSAPALQSAALNRTPRTSANASSPLGSGRRWAGMAGVVVLHGALIWILHASLLHEPVRSKERLVHAELVQEPQPPAPAPSLPQPFLPPPAPASPVRPSVKPLIASPATTMQPDGLDSTPSANVMATSASLAAAPSSQGLAPIASAVAPVAAPASKPSVKTSAVVSASACSEKPQYPPISQRNQEEGAVLLRMLVGVDGRVLKSEIDQTSGFRRLDEAARLALATCVFKPATLDGKPVEEWTKFRYQWEIRE